MNTQRDPEREHYRKVWTIGLKRFLRWSDTVIEEWIAAHLAVTGLAWQVALNSPPLRDFPGLIVRAHPTLKDLTWAQSMRLEEKIQGIIYAGQDGWDFPLDYDWEGVIKDIAEVLREEAAKPMDD